MMRKKGKAVFTKISLAVILCFLLPGCSLSRNFTEKLISEHPVELIAAEIIIPNPASHNHYEITPDLKVRWYECDPYDWSDSAEILYIYEMLLTQRQYDDIIKAITTNDFISFPEDHEPWEGDDGSSQEIAITLDGTTYRSGGYFPTETDSKFANVWSTLESTGVFDQQDYTVL